MGLLRGAAAQADMIAVTVANDRVISAGKAVERTILHAMCGMQSGTQSAATKAWKSPNGVGSWCLALGGFV